MSKFQERTSDYPVRNHNDELSATYFVTLTVPVTIAATKGTEVAASMTTGDYTSVVFCRAISESLMSEIREFYESGSLESMISDIDPKDLEIMGDTKNLPAFAKYVDGDGTPDQPSRLVLPLTGKERIIKSLNARIAYYESQIDAIEEDCSYLKSFLNGQINGFREAIDMLQPIKAE